MDRQTEKVDAEYDKIRPVGRYALAFRALADGSKSIQLLNRYETGHRRSYYKALSTLLQLRAELKKNPIPVEPPAQPAAEPDKEPIQPEKNQDVSQAQPDKKHFCETNPRNDERT